MGGCRNGPTNSRLSRSEDDMNNGARITEIDITKQARALACLRLTNSARRIKATLLKVSGVALLVIAVLGLIVFQAIRQEAPFWELALLFALLAVVVAAGRLP